ncbi:Calx-beta domain-containing protein [Desulfovibrio cuneatus]|uniref:Calx-beta domain-containing protein n=1 Tax=Desulfovibrio cuneatus TaxID=159728 RepID=UPI0004048BBA|nr:Calx-beta domain-containing protein [Desulfovibrio cuneatus]
MNSVATVSQISGEAYVERNGQKVALQQGDPVFVADTVLTSADSKLELHFADDAVISLGASTKIAVQDFAFDPQGKTPPSFALEMLDGLVRSVSGKVVEQNPEAFKLSSPLGTVGIRGTETLHHITMKYEVHTVVNMETGHTVVITTPDGRQVIIAESLKGVTIFQDNPGPLNPRSVNPDEIQEELKQTFANDEPGARPLNGFFVLADTAFLSASGANHVEGGPAFISGAQIQSLFGALNNFMTSLGYSGLSHSLGQFGSGISNYSDYSGSLVGSIGRMLAYGNAWNWSNNASSADFFPVLPPSAPIVVPSTPTAPIAPTGPTLAIGLQYGSYYFANNQKVLESDPFGIQCRLQLSAPTTGQPLILSIGGNAVAGTHYERTLGVGDIIEDWKVYPAANTLFSAFSEPLPIDGAYITWLGDGKIAIHLPPGVTSFYFQVPLIDTLGGSSAHTFEYTLVDSGGYTLSTSPTGKVTIVPDEVAQENGWVPPVPGTPEYNDFITNLNVPGPKGPLVAITQGSGSVLENADQSYSISLTPRGGTLALTGGTTTIVLEITGKNGALLGNTNFDGTTLASTIASTYGITATYDDTTGKLTITLPNGWTGTSIDFSTGLTPDSTVETGTASEQINIRVESVAGNEASHNPEKIETDIIDIPTVSVEAGAASFSEDGGTVTFTFTLSSGIPSGLPITLDWTGTAAGGCKLLNGDPLPTSITIPAGQTTYTITVKGTNDHLQTGNKPLNVTIVPDGGTAEANDNYHVSGTDGTADATRIDDVPANYDGPLVRLVAGTGDVSTNGNDRHAVVNEDGSAGNTNGGITFKVELVDRANTTQAYSAQETITVTLTLAGKGGAAYGTDYKLDWAAIQAIDSAATFDNITGKLVIHLPAGTTSFSLPVITLSDAIKETGEGFSLKIDSVDGNESTVLQSKDTVETDIADGETLVSLTTNATPVNEGSNVTGTITLDKTFTEPVTITLKLNDGNGNITTHNVTVAAGSTTATYSLPTINTDKQEGNRTYTVSVDKVETASNAAAEAVADPTNGTATGTLQDVMNGPVLNLTSSGTTVSEAGTATYTVNLTKASVEPIDVVLTLSPTGTNGATIGTDVKWPDNADILSSLPSGFSIVSNVNGVLTIRVPANYAGGSFSVNASIVNDTLAEANESFKVTLGLGTPSVNAPGSEATLNNAQKEATTTITDDGNGPQISITADKPAMEENEGTSLFTISVNGTPSEPIDLKLSFSSSAGGATLTGTNADVKWPTAAEVQNYLTTNYGAGFTATANGDNTLTIRVPAGFALGAFKVPVTVVNDVLTENPESFNVNVAIVPGTNGNGSEAKIASGGGSATVTITDDANLDPSLRTGPKLRLVALDASNTPVADRDVSVMEDNASKQGSTITYRLELLDRNDGTTPQAAGEEIKVTIDVKSLGGATYGSGTGGDFYFDLASIPAKYKATYDSGSGKLTIYVPKGENHVDIPVKTVPDLLTEKDRPVYDANGDPVMDGSQQQKLEDEGFELKISDVHGNEASIITDKNTITTEIDEEPSGVQVGIRAIAASNVKEEGVAKFQIFLSQAADEDVEVILRPTGASKDNFETLRFIIPKGQTTLNIEVPIANDQVSEGTVPFTMEIADVIGGEGFVNTNASSANGSFTDNMDGPEISITGDANAQESQADAIEYTISLGGTYPVPVEDIDLRITLSNSVDAKFGDFADLWDALADQGIELLERTSDGSILVRVPTGWNGGSFNFPVNVVDDFKTEGPETITVSVAVVTSTEAPGSEATVKSGEGSTSTVIADDDTNITRDGPFLKLVGTGFISESGGYANYKVILCDAHGNPIDPSLITEDVTITLGFGPTPGAPNQAQERVDYELLPGQETLVIRAGTNSASVDIRIADDNLTEENKSFDVWIDDATGQEVRYNTPTLQDNKVTTVIVDDTQPWPKDGNNQPVEGVGSEGHGAEAKLEGPAVSLFGPGHILEPEFGSTGEADFTLKLSSISQEDVTVTIKLDIAPTGTAGVKGFDLADLFAGTTSAAILAELEALNPTLTFSNWQQSGTGYTFDITVTANSTFTTFKLPIQADDISENNCTFITKIEKVTGNEAHIDTNLDDVQTTIVDEPLGGPKISLEVKDYNADGSSSWGSSADLPETYTPSDSGDTDKVYFRLTTDRVVSEPTEVVFRLYDSNRNVIDRGLIPGLTKGVDAYGTYYKITIPAEQNEVTFSVPKIVGQYDYFQLQAESATGSETVIDQDSCITEAEQHWGSTTTRPIVSVEKVNGNSSHDAEGADAAFRLKVTNGSIDTPTTVTLKISGLNTGFNTADIKELNGVAITWLDPSRGLFTVTLPAGQSVLNFTLGLQENDGYEGPESYIINVVGTEGKAWSGNSATGVIDDGHTPPTVSLGQEGTGTFQEGTSAKYYLEFDTAIKPTELVTVKLTYTSNGATPGDYTPVNTLYIDPSDSNWSFDNATQKWRYSFSVELPNDEFSEGNEQFKVEIADISQGFSKNPNPVETTIEEVKDGPTISFDHGSATVAEDGVNAPTFELVLTRPAVEDVFVYLRVNAGSTKVSGTNDPASPLDVDFSRISGATAIWDNTENCWFIKVKIPKGDIQATLDLAGIFNNDKSTELDENFSFTIDHVDGGEVHINSGKDTAAITLEDSRDGDSITVTADKTSVNEWDGVEGNTDTLITYTFSLPPGVTATEPITITFTVGGIRADGLSADDLRNVFGTHTVTIPAGANSITWVMKKDALVNDKIDERSPAEGIVVEITNVHGNEAGGEGGKATVTITDDDHAPVTNPDDVVILVAPHSGNDSWTIDVLHNDTDADGDPLRTVAKTIQGRYGTFSIDDNGNMTYTVDNDSTAIKNGSKGDKFTEFNGFSFEVADTDALTGNAIYNIVNSNATLEVQVTDTYTGNGNAQWIMGSGQAEKIDAGGGADVVRAGGGNDTITVNNDAKGEYFGDAGSDTFVVKPKTGIVAAAADFGTIHGGNGTTDTEVDSITLAGTGQTLSFTGWDGTKITGIEVLDITGTGDNNVLLDLDAVTKLNAQRGDTTNPIRIVGNEGDTFTLTDAETWTATGPETVNGANYYRLTNGSQELLVHESVRLVVNGTAGADAIDVASLANQGTGRFVVEAGDGNDTITAGTSSKDIVNAGAGDDVITLNDAGTPNGTFDKDDITKVDGGAGNDTLRFAGAAGLVMDFTTGLHANIKNVEVLDLSQSAGSILRLNGAAFQALATTDTGNRLYVEGGNTLELCNTTENTFANWQYASTDGDYYVLQWGADASKQLYVHNSVTLSINGGTGADTINFADYPGALTITSGDGNDTITAGNGVNTITAGLGNDSITGGTGSGTYNGGTGNDTITGGTGNEAINGDDGADVLRGGGGADTIHGGAGTDTLYNGSAQEALFGDADNDTFILHSLTNSSTVTVNDFGTIDGGTGTDVLKLASTDQTLDLSGLGTGEIDGIETISLTGTGANHLILDASTLTNMGIANGGILAVTGDAADTFELQGTWTFAGENGSNVQYRDPNGCLVELPGTMRRVVADAIALPDKDASGIITADELGTITGKTGLTTLTLDSSQNDTVLDLVSIANSQITNINTIKLDGFGSNNLVIGANTLANMGLGSGTLTVEGDTNDTFVLQGAWAFAGLDNGYATYTLGGATLKVHSNINQLYQGTPSNDTFALVDKDNNGIISGNDFARIDGKAGNDLLALDATQTGKTLDLSNLGANKINGVEIIDLSGAGNNRLVLDENTLTNMGLAANETLTVYGTAQDSFELKGTGWNYIGLDNGYYVYSNNAGQFLHVQEGLTRAQEGTSAHEIFSIIDTDTIGGITAADFATIHGNGGNDTLRIDAHASQDDKSLDLTGLGAGQISGIATIDLTGNGNNLLRLDASTIGNMGVDTLTVTGNAGDTFELAGNDWSYQGVDANGQLFQDASGKSLLVGFDMLKMTAPGTLTNTSGSDYLLGTSADDTFTLKGFNAGTTFVGLDFGKVDGGEGHDIVSFEEDYRWINLTNLGAGKLTNIEGISLTDHGANQLDVDENTFEANKHYIITGDANDTVNFVDVDTNWTYESLADGWANFVHNTNGTTVAIAEALMQGYPAPSSLMAPASMTATEETDVYAPTASQSEPLTGENTSSVLELATFTQNGMDTIALHDGQILHIDADGLNALHEKGGVAMISGDETTEVVLESVTLFRTGSTVELEGNQFEYCTFTAPDETEIQMLIQTTLLTGQAG